MKKLLFIISSVLLGISCNKKEYVAENYDFQPEIQYETSATAYKDLPISLRLIINSDNATVLSSIEMNYYISDGDGYITVDDTNYTSYTNFTPENISDGVMYFEYTATQSGTQTLNFNVSNGISSKSSSLEILVEEVYYNVLVEGDTDNFKLGRKESFDVIINLVNEDNTVVSCNATAAINQGDGTIEYNGTELGTTQTSMTLGRNTISYTPTVRGENIIQLNLYAENGYVQPVYIPITVGVPEFSIELVREDNDAITAGQDYSFVVYVNDDNLEIENEYTITYRFISNTGTVKINNTEVDSGEIVDCLIGSNVIHYSAAATGTADIQFIVTDKYNSEETVNAQFDVTMGALSVSVNQFYSSINCYSYTPLDVAVQQIGYTGEYSIACTLIKGNATMLWNNTTYQMDGTWIEGLSNSEVIKVNPLVLGELEFYLKIKDENSEVSENIVCSYEIVEGEPNFIISISELSSSVNMGEENNFVLTLQEDGLTNDNEYTLAYRFVNNTGTVKINNSSVDTGVKTNCAIGSNYIYFTPLLTGYTDMEFTVSDKYNTERIINAQFDVENGKIIILPTQTSGAEINNSTGYSVPLDLLITQAGYTGEYSIALVTENGSATFTLDNETYEMNGNWVSGISSAETLYINPTSDGSLKFSIRAKNSSGEYSESYYVSYYVENPIEFSFVGEETSEWTNFSFYLSIVCNTSSTVNVTYYEDITLNNSALNAAIDDETNKDIDIHWSTPYEGSILFTKWEYENYDSPLNINAEKNYTLYKDGQTFSVTANLLKQYVILFYPVYYKRALGWTNDDYWQNLEWSFLAEEFPDAPISAQFGEIKFVASDGTFSKTFVKRIGINNYGDIDDSEIGGVNIGDANYVEKF